MRFQNKIQNTKKVTQCLQIVKSSSVYTHLIVAGELSGNPNKRFFEIVIIFSRNLEVLKILLSVECYLLRLHFSVLNFYFVSAEDDRDILANTGQISVKKVHGLV